jgi:hypothetical protein
MNSFSISTDFSKKSDEQFSFLLLQGEIDAALNSWKAEEQELSSMDATKLGERNQKWVNQIRDRAMRMKMLGCSLDEIREAIKQSAQEMRASNQEFRAGCASYNQNKQIVRNNLRDTTKKIEGMNISFASFVPDSPDVNEVIKFSVKTYLKNKIEQKFGKGTAELADNLQRFFTVQPSEKEENPWRYCAVSVGVQYGMVKALASFLPQACPIYAGITATHVVALYANRGTSLLRKMETDIEADTWWKQQCQRDYGEGLTPMQAIKTAQGILELSKIPSLCLRTIQNQLMDACTVVADRIHFTDANVAKIARVTLEYMANHAPDVLAERMWVVH